MKLVNFAKSITVIMIVAVIFTGCRKELNQPVNPNSASSADFVLTDVDALAVQADNDFVNSEITGGTESEEFAISNDGLPDAYCVTEATADINSLRRDVDGAGIRKCLSELKLSDEQIAKIRRIFKGYEECKHSVIVRHRNISQELLKKYNSKRDELLKALRNGRITKAQFEAKMKELRKMYNAEREALNQKARAALKDCYTKMLRSLNGVLTERQWKAFVNCYRH